MNIIHFTVDRHLGCFQFAVITNAATINISMHISYMYIYIPQIYVLEQQERYTCYFITKNEDDNNSK